MSWVCPGRDRPSTGASGMVVQHAAQTCRGQSGARDPGGERWAAGPRYARCGGAKRARCLRAPLTLPPISRFSTRSYSTPIGARCAGRAATASMLHARFADEIRNFSGGPRKLGVRARTAVLRQGDVAAGRRIEVTGRPAHGVTCALVFRALLGERWLLEPARAAQELPAELRLDAAAHSVSKASNPARAAPARPSRPAHRRHSPRSG